MILKKISWAVLVSMSLTLGACGGGGSDTGDRTGPAPDIETKLNASVETKTIAAPISGIDNTRPDMSIDPVPGPGTGS